MAWGATAASIPANSWADATIRATVASDRRPTDHSLNSNVANAIDFRRSFGFVSDATVVAAYEADESLNRDYGVALTQPETAEMARRDAIAVAVGPMVAELRQTDGFAGLFIDQAAGGVVDFAFVGEVPLPSDWTGRYLPPGTEVRFRTADYSYAELRELQDLITKDWLQLKSDGIPLVSVGVDPRMNRVLVGVDGSPEDAAPVFSEAYGPRVTVRQEQPEDPTACNTREDCPPMKGGITIDGNTKLCTSGFNGRPVAASSARYIITAGHCIKDDGLGSTWSHNGVDLGISIFHDYHQGSSADVGVIAHNTTGPHYHYYAVNNLSIRKVTAGRPNDQQPVGATICRAGVASNPEWKCGEVLLDDRDVEIGGVLFHHMWKQDFSNVVGDSGGPITNGSTSAMGVVASITFYSTIDGIADQSGVRPCYSITC
jgi:hypothetical protein